MIWDRILIRGAKDNDNLLKNVPGKYHLGKLKSICGRDITLSVRWISTPYVGMFYDYQHEGSKFTFKLPNDVECTA